jgi:phosphoglycerate dehydrogenase-like enzyme
VIAANRTVAPHASVEEVHGLDALDRMLPEADVVTLHCQLTPGTRRLMSAARLRQMKRGAMLINTSRGAVVDEAALIAALADGHIGAAYLDVFEAEPLPAESPLWAMPNVMITPHASDNTTDWVPRFARFFAENVERWNRGQEMPNVVHP